MDFEATSSPHLDHPESGSIADHLAPIHCELPEKKPAIYLLLLLAVTGITGLNGCQRNPDVPSSIAIERTTSSPVATLPKQPNQNINVDSNFIVTVVEKVGPAVVRIDSSRTISQNQGNEWDEPLLRRFSGRNPASDRVERGTGSGFLISADGQVLTNAHVINGADRVNVKLKDGRSFAGKVLGEDPLTDVAVVKIQSTNLPTVALGNSDYLRSGEWAIAIGNPLGLDNSVTIGIVSATERSSSQIGVPDKRVGFIQTDAAINPGNSGGPLLNASGEVIGINTAIIQGAQGLGFAIPINTAQQIAQQLITKGKVQHAYLGIVMVTLTPEIKQKINHDSQGQTKIQEDDGVLIVRVVPKSPAAIADLRPGDIIKKLNEQSIQKTEQVQQIIENTGIGANLKVQLRRNGKTMNVTVQPGDLPVRSTRRQPQ